MILPRFAVFVALLSAFLSVIAASAPDGPGVIGSGWSLQRPDRSARFDLDAVWEAAHPDKDWSGYFTQRGLRVAPDGERPPAWEWGVSVVRFGHGSSSVAVSPGEPVVDAGRVRYDHGSLLEWMILQPGGIEHGFTFGSRPASDGSGGMLWVETELLGGLLPSMHTDGRGMFFRQPDGTPVLRYTGLEAFDSSGRTLAARMKITGRRLLIEVDDSDAVYPVSIDPLVSTPTWSVKGAQVGMELGFSMATAGDINGDGYSDLLVGSPHYDGDFASSGLVELYLGGSGGPAATPDWSSGLVSGDAGSEYGFSVATASDVNGDGYDDVLVGAPGGLEGAGRAFLYLGSATGLSTVPVRQWVGDQAGARLGAVVAWAGDIDRDGFADVLIAEPDRDGVAADTGRVSVYRGSPEGLEPTPHRILEGVQAGERLGAAVSTALDVNGDGFDDVVVGAPGASATFSGEGRAALHLGGAGGLAAAPAWEMYGGQSDAEMGASVAGGGDFDGDGYADLLVGAPGTTDDQTEEGAAFAFHGSASGPASSATWTLYGDRLGARLGAVVATAGDMGGDGYADAVFGAPSYDVPEGNSGYMTVYEGSPEGLASTSSLEIRGSRSQEMFGHAVGTAGDVNGDGLGDVVVGAPGDGYGSLQAGKARVYLGGSYDFDEVADWSLIGSPPDAWLGVVSSAGDVNGDGFDDVLVGARGEVRLFLGSAAGLAGTPLWIVSDTDLGRVHAGAGDVNGDGYADIVLADPGYDTALVDVGRVQLYLGSPSGPRATPDWVLVGTLSEGEFGASVAGAGDVNGDGYADLVVGEENFRTLGNGLGRAYLYMGSAGGLNISPAWMSESDQGGSVYGRSVSSAGDVNADGFADVLVAAPYYENGNFREGRVYLYLGSPAGLSQAPAWTAEPDIGIQPYGTSFGEALAAAGDVNGDGYGDVIIGAPRYNETGHDQGAAFLYLGAPGGLTQAPAWSMVGEWSSIQLGSMVAPAGDVDGDGYDDVAVGTPFWNVSFPWILENAGRVTVYLGSESGPSTEPAWAVYGESWSFMGHRNEIAGNLDVDADGYPDLLVGASRYDVPGGGWDVGAVWLYHGGEDVGRPWPVFQSRTGDGGSILPWGRSDAEDAFELRADGFSAAGRQPVRLDWERRLPGEVFHGTDFERGLNITDSGAPGPDGSVATIRETVGLLTADTAFHWRLRVATTGPLFPHGPWRRLTGGGRHDPDIRTLKPGNPQDVDGDGFDESLDCNDADGSLWGAPSETLHLRFGSEKAGLQFDPPWYPGSLPSALLFDTLRSGDPNDFVTGAVCIAQNMTLPVAADPTIPPVGGLFHYLSRGKNGCGPGSLGASSDGMPRSGRSCP